MENLPDSVLLNILSRLNDSADVARCRVASKPFNTVFPGIRSVNFDCSIPYSQAYENSTGGFKSVFLDFISKLETVESVSVFFPGFLCNRPNNDDCYIIDEDFTKLWLPKVSESLKYLAINGFPDDNKRQTSFLPLVSVHCQNLVKLCLKFGWLTMSNVNLMPMLTTLALAFTKLEDENLSELNKCFPNLQVLKLINVKGIKDPKIHLLKLKTCVWHVYNHAPSLTLITPSLTTLEIKCLWPAAVHIEAPVLSHLNLSLVSLKFSGALTVKKFENLKTLSLNSLYTGSLLSGFPITKTVEDLTLDSGNEPPRDAVVDPKLTLGKVFTIFPNVSSLRVNAGTWSEFEACLNPEGWDILDGRKGLKTIHADLELVDPSLTFSYIACVLDQCVALSEVSLLINVDVEKTISETFMSKCMVRWPGLKWRWGIWGDDIEDTWITNAISD